MSKNISYIEIIDALNGPIQLQEVIANNEGKKMVGLREITFTADWFNISEKLGNNMYSVRIVDNVEFDYTITDGYYNISLLEKELQKDMPDFKLDHDLARDIITMKNLPIKVASYNFSKLAELIGCRTGWIHSNNDHVCEKPHKFYTHKTLYVHLEQINATNNILARNQSGIRSNLLRKIPTNDIQFGESTTITFEKPQFRRLCEGSINELEFSILDRDGKNVNINNCFITLEIKDII